MSLTLDQIESRLDLALAAGQTNQNALALVIEAQTELSKHLDTVQQTFMRILALFDTLNNMMGHLTDRLTLIERVLPPPEVNT